MVQEKAEGGNGYRTDLGNPVDTDSGGGSTDGVLADEAGGVVEEGGGQAERGGCLGLQLKSTLQQYTKYFEVLSLRSPRLRRACSNSLVEDMLTQVAILLSLHPLPTKYACPVKCSRVP